MTALSFICLSRFAVFVCRIYSYKVFVACVHCNPCLVFVQSSLYLCVIKPFLSSLVFICYCVSNLSVLFFCIHLAMSNLLFVISFVSISFFVFFSLVCPVLSCPSNVICLMCYCIAAMLVWTYGIFHGYQNTNTNENLVMFLKSSLIITSFQILVIFSTLLSCSFCSWVPGEVFLKN